MTKSDWGMAVVVLLGIVFVGWLVFGASEAPELAYAPVEVTGSTMTASAGAPYRVDAYVTLKQPGFVTVHQSLGGAPGPIVATSPYLEVTSVIASIEVDPPLVVGQPYVALLHLDDGDGTFVVEDDLPVMSNGSVVRADFVAEEETAE